MPAHKERIGWPGWETGNLLGRGSFGSVYEIHRDILGDMEKAALKIISIPNSPYDVEELRNDGYDEESITAAFKSHLKSIVAEYSLMRKLRNCPNIVNCDDVRYVQHDDGIGWDIFIKMELLTPMLKILPSHIPENLAIKLGKDICTALVECSRYNIIHRDIKPQNIFVSSQGDFKLGDFGIAKITEKTMGGTKTGTYNYMAPEIYNNQPYGTASDIYTLGLVLYWMLNERRMPFLPLPPAKLNSDLDVKARHKRFSGEPFPSPAHGSEELKKIVLKACAFNPKDRYSSAQEMLKALELLESMPIPEAEDHDATILTQANTPAREDDRSPDGTDTGPDTIRVAQTNEKKTEPIKTKKKQTSIWGIFPLILIVAFLTLFLLFEAGMLSPENHSNSIIPSTAATGSVVEADFTQMLPLTECDLIEDSNSGGKKQDVVIGNWVDTFGDLHPASIKFWVINTQGMNNMEYIVYDLNYEYSQLDLRLFLEEHSHPNASAYLKIYLDDVYIQSSGQVLKDSFQELTINTTGASKLRIECITESKHEAFGLVSANLYS